MEREGGVGRGGGGVELVCGTGGKGGSRWVCGRCVCGIGGRDGGGEGGGWSRACVA